MGDIPFHTDEEGFFIELKLRNTKWLLFGGYNLKKKRVYCKIHKEFRKCIK